MVFQEMVLTCLSFLCFYVVTYVYFGLISSSFIWGVLSFSSSLMKVNLQYHSERSKKKKNPSGTSSNSEGQGGGRGNTAGKKQERKGKIYCHMRKMYINKIAFKTIVRRSTTGKDMVQQCYSFLRGQ